MLSPRDWNALQQCSTPEFILGKKKNNSRAVAAPLPSDRDGTIDIQSPFTARGRGDL